MVKEAVGVESVELGESWIFFVLGNTVDGATNPMRRGLMDINALKLLAMLLKTYPKVIN
jgi:hypothetical protein